MAPSTREVLARQKNARVVLGEVTRHRPRGAHGDLRAPRSHERHPVRQPPRRGRLRAVLVRQRPLRGVRPRDEVGRRRARAARPDLRCLRGRRGHRRPAGRRPGPDLRRRRRRPDRGRDGRADRRARATAPSSTTSGGSTPGRPGSSSSTGPTPCCRRSASGSGSGQGAPRGDGRRGQARLDGHRRRRGGTIEFTEPDGSRTPHRDPHEGVGGRGAGEPARCAARRAVRGRGRPRGPRAGQRRPHAPRAPGGVRRRRHDGARGPPRRRAGRHPGVAVRGEGDHRPARRQALPGRVRVLRQGVDGDRSRGSAPSPRSESCASTGSSPGCCGWGSTSSTSSASRTG